MNLEWGAEPGQPPPPPPQRRPDEPLPRHIWRFSDLLLGLLAISPAAALCVLTFWATGVEGVTPSPEREIRRLGAILTIAFQGVFGVAVLLLIRRRKLSLSAIGLGGAKRWGLLPVAVVGAYGSIILYRLALDLVAYMFEIDVGPLGEGNPVPQIAGDDLVTWVLLGVAVVVVAPVAEELFFRGLVFRALAGWWGPSLAFVVSGAAFALFHCNLSVVVPFALIGAVFAWAYWASGSLWVPIVAHAIVNGVSFILTVAGVEP